jgi:hypothetical protein
MLKRGVFRETKEFFLMNGMIENSHRKVMVHGYSMMIEKHAPKHFCKTHL